MTCSSEIPNEIPILVNKWIKKTRWFSMKTGDSASPLGDLLRKTTWFMNKKHLFFGPAHPKLDILSASIVIRASEKWMYQVG